MDEKLEQILKLTSEYILEKRKNKVWIPGKDWVQYAGSVYDDKEYVAAIGSLLKEWLVLGECGMKFEKEFPKEFNKKFGLLTNSGSSANLLMMTALRSKRLNNFKDGTKVLIPVAGFPTTLNPTIQNRFVPIFVDIELNSLNLDIDKLEQAIEQNPDAKILTFAHVLGNPPNMRRIMALVKKHNLILLEDCCDALGSTYEGLH